MVGRSGRSLEFVGSYILPGRVLDARVGLEQARAAEDLGLGTVWVSERWDTKELGAVCGALTQATSRARIATGVSHFGTRHPIVVAGWALTMQVLSGGRFVLGFGRSRGPRWEALGIPVPTGRIIADHVAILRRLWDGETVTYDGPAGRYPAMRLDDVPDVAPPPLLLAALGPRTLELAGRSFDGVVLHGVLTPEAVARSSGAVRAAAEAAGRDPGAVKIFATVITAPDGKDADVRDIVGARAITYLRHPGYGQSLAKVNGWDVSVIDRLQARVAALSSSHDPADQAIPRSTHAEISGLLPTGWLLDASAVGSARECASRWHDFLDARADELVIHGATAEMLGPTSQAFVELARP